MVPDVAKEGDRVRFDVNVSRNGKPAATNGRLVDSTEAAAEAMFGKADFLVRG